MPNFIELPSWDEQGRLRVVVETPRGSAFKIHFDPATRAFTFQRPLRGQRYPDDWGFVPGTAAEDGDPLDALVLHDASTWPGVIIPSQPIAILKIRDQKAGTERELQNDRIIAIPALRRSSSTDALTAEKRRELEEFFRTTGEQTGKKVRVLGWGGVDEARAAVEQTRSR